MTGHDIAETAALRLAGLVDSRVGLIRYLSEEIDRLPDEIPSVLMRAELAPTALLSDGGYEYVPAHGGRSLERSDALVGAIFESYERYCLSIYRDLRWCSYTELVADGAHAVHPREFVGTRRRARLADLDSRPLRWCPGRSLLTGEQTWVPAQAVFVPYAFTDDELPLRDPISTGAAAGVDQDSAAHRGLLEVVERDAVMLMHYRSAGHRVDMSGSSDPRLRRLLAESARLGLRTTFVQIDNGLPVDAVACLISDPEGRYPAQSVGSKASVSIEDAALGALLEAATLRRSARARRTMLTELAAKYAGPSDIDSLESRMAVWAQPGMAAHLAYVDEMPVVQSNSRWRSAPELIAAISRVGTDIVVVDVTTSDVARLGIDVVKVVVPGLQTMHLSEQFPCWGDRLPGGPGKDAVPHPFL
jgi:ribosomal protein S12 methylthiotransferase accessory factor